MSEKIITAHLERSATAMADAARDGALVKEINAIATAMTQTLRAGGKILIAGNGGSAGDAQHIAAEIVGRYKRERKGWAAIALTTDTSALTAIANDYGFEQVFARQVEGLGRKGDVFIGLTTSGKSPNILAALKTARAQGLVTIGFTGLKGASMGALCDHLLVAPTEDTPIVQQIHLAAGHAICDAVEQDLA